MASNLDGFQPRSNGLQPNSDGLQPKCDGLQPRSDGLQPRSDGLQPRNDGLKSRSDGLQPVLAMASNLEEATTSNLVVIASNLECDGLQSKSDGLQTGSDGLQPTVIGMASWLVGQQLWHIDWRTRSTFGSISTSVGRGHGDSARKSMQYAETRAHPLLGLRSSSTSFAKSSASAWPNVWLRGKLSK